MNLVKGLAIAVLIPVLFKIIPMAVITEIISIVPNSSFIARMKLLKTPIIALESEDVANNPKINIPNIHTKVISFFNIISTRIINIIRR